jgi:hypothetical protein
LNLSSGEDVVAVHWKLKPPQEIRNYFGSATIYFFSPINSNAYFEIYFSNIKGNFEILETERIKESKKQFSSYVRRL